MIARNFRRLEYRVPLFCFLVCLGNTGCFVPRYVDQKLPQGEFRNVSGEFLVVDAEAITFHIQANWGDREWRVTDRETYQLAKAAGYPDSVLDIVTVGSSNDTNYIFGVGRSYWRWNGATIERERVNSHPPAIQVFTRIGNGNPAAASGAE